MRQIEINDNDNILIIAPHPDDESIGMGGFLIKYGKKCDVWIMTDGSKCQTSHKKEEIVSIRKNELCAAMEYCKVNHYFNFEIEDKTLALNDDVFDDVNLNKYSKIFIPSIDEKHIDHISTSSLALEAIKVQKSDAEVFFYEISNPMRAFDAILDITDCINEKKQLISLYRSQMEVFNYCEAAYHLNGFRACMLPLNNSFIEVFKQVDANNYRNNIMQIENERKQIIINILMEWIKASSTQDNIGDALRSDGINSIDVYGYGQLGRLFCDVIKAEGITKINTIIDRNYYREKGFTSIKDYSNNSDAVIITILGDTKGVFKKLREKHVERIYTLKDLFERIRGK